MQVKTELKRNTNTKSFEVQKRNKQWEKNEILEIEGEMFLFPVTEDSITSS